MGQTPHYLNGSCRALWAVNSYLDYISFFRTQSDDSDIDKFETTEKYEHEEDVDHLKNALIQETEESADGSTPKIIDVELSRHQDSQPLVVTYLKVLFVCLNGRHPQRNVGVPYFRDLASRPGVGICNTPKLPGLTDGIRACLG